MRKLILIVTGMLLSGCVYTIASINKGRTLEEKPFAVVPMKGSPGEAAACIGKYWQSSINKSLDADYQVSILPFQVEVGYSFFGANHPVVSLVVNLDEQDHQTIARAYCHPIHINRPQKSVTLEALEYCKSSVTTSEAVNPKAAKTDDAIKAESKPDTPPKTKKSSTPPDIIYIDKYGGKTDEKGNLIE